MRCGACKAIFTTSSVLVGTEIVVVDFVPMMFTFTVFLVLSVHARSGEAEFAPAKRMESLDDTSLSELKVYCSNFWPVRVSRDVTLIFMPPSNVE